MSSKIPSLSLLNNLSSPIIGSGAYPKERRINRSILLDVSPDREELFDNSSIEDLRERLKLQLDTPQGRWLCDSASRRSAGTLRGDGATRYSSLNSSRDKENLTDGAREHTHGQGLSDSARAFNLSGTADKIKLSGDIWGTKSLSTQDWLISPRVLGPTHILVVSELCGGGATETTMDVGHTLDLPINDLLFILNVPNLRATRKNGRHVSALPRRLHGKLPRVALRVPALQTFPEVVIYLHTQDADDLFRRLVPDWIRDIVGPLLSSAHLPVAPLTEATTRVCNTGDIELSGSQCLPGLGIKQGLRIVKKASVKCLRRPISPTLTLGRPRSRSCDTADAVEARALEPADNTPCKSGNQRAKPVSLAAKKIVEAYLSGELGVQTAGADYTLDLADTPNLELNVLELTSARLHALAANLKYLGYFERSLWTALDLYRDVIQEALNLVVTTSSLKV